MNWEDEPFIKLYTRDTGEIAGLSWEARSVFWALLRKLDRLGRTKLGKRPAKALAGLLQCPRKVAETALEELLEDEFVVMDGDVLVVPSHAASQEARQSAKARKAAQRDREAAQRAAADVTKRDQKSRDVTTGHAGSPTVTNRDMSQNVTSGHEMGHPVTNCDEKSRDVTRRHGSSQMSPLEENRIDQNRLDLSLGGAGGGKPTPAKKTKRASRAEHKRIADDWQPDAELRAQCHDPKHGELPDRIIDDLVPAFVDHWLAKTGKDSMKPMQAWRAAFRTWCRNHRKFNANVPRYVEPSPPPELTPLELEAKARIAADLQAAREECEGKSVEELQAIVAANIRGPARIDPTTTNEAANG